MKKKSRHSPLTLSIKPIDRVAVKILGGDEKNELADTDPDSALEECLNWAYRGIEGVNELRHIEGRLKQQILDLIADLRKIPSTESAERKARIHRFKSWLGAHPPQQSPTGKWNI
jgi:hypothetical protein